MRSTRSPSDESATTIGSRHTPGVTRSTFFISLLSTENGVRADMCCSENGVSAPIVSGCYPPPGLDHVSHGDRGRDGKKSQRSDDADAECVGVAAAAEGSEERGADDRLSDRDADTLCGLQDTASGAAGDGVDPHQ